MKVFEVTGSGRGVIEGELNLQETFEWHGSRVQAYKIREKNKNKGLLRVMENYGPGAIERVFYLNRQAAEDRARELRQGAVKLLKLKIKDLERQIRELE